jgi:hypothetical protein
LPVETNVLVYGGTDVSLAARIDMLCNTCDRAVDGVASLIIPDEQVEGVAATVLGLYATRAEALGATASAFFDGGESLAELEHARAELRAMEDALSDLRWPRLVFDGTVELVGPPRVLRELMRAALSDAANAVAQTVARYEAGGAELPELCRAVEAVPAMFGLFASFEDDASSPCEQGS